MPGQFRCILYERKLTENWISTCTPGDEAPPMLDMIKLAPGDATPIRNGTAAADCCARWTSVAIFAASCAVRFSWFWPRSKNTMQAKETQTFWNLLQTHSGVYIFGPVIVWTPRENTGLGTPFFLIWFPGTGGPDRHEKIFLLTVVIYA